MGFSTAVLGALSLLLLPLIASTAQPLVPALFIFGDSTNDVGNNNNLDTIIKANFPPYGRDFNHTPTGRFCNGKIAADFTSEKIGFTSYPPAYLSTEARGRRLLAGANFASAASGYFDQTAAIYNAVSLAQQLEYYKEYQSEVVKMVGGSNASSIFSGGVYLLGTGSTDYILNYYINPLLYQYYTTDAFADMLVGSFAKFIRELYKLGGRRVGVMSLPPLGCLPAAITLFSGGSKNNGCVGRLNEDATHFNRKLNASALAMQKKFTNLTIVVFDIYTPLFDLIINPSDNGFFESRKACCGTGTIETSFLCNKDSPGTCDNATGYVFWDSVHPTESANKFLSNKLLIQGISLIS